MLKFASKKIDFKAQQKANTMLIFGSHTSRKQEPKISLPTHVKNYFLVTQTLTGSGGGNTCEPCQ